MQVIQTFVRALLSVMKVMGGPMMYRYPYRTSAEGMRADWLNIGKDIQNVMYRLEEHSKHGQRSDSEY